MNFKIMKRLMFVGACVAMLMTSCSEDVTQSNLTVVSNEYATINVTFQAELDETTSGKESIGKKEVIISTPMSSFVKDAKGLWTMVDSTDANGVLSVEVPIGTEAVTTTYTVKVNDFVADKTKLDGTKQKFVYGLYFTKALVANEVYYARKTVGDNDEDDYEDAGVITYTLYAYGDFSEKTTDDEQVPNTSPLTLINESTNASWRIESSNGESVIYNGKEVTKYTFQAPVTFNASFVFVQEFSANKLVWTGEYNYDDDNNRVKRYDNEQLIYGGANCDFVKIDDTHYKVDLGTGRTILP